MERKFLGFNKDFPKVFSIGVEKGFACSFKARSFSSESLERDFFRESPKLFPRLPDKAINRG